MRRSPLASCGTVALPPRHHPAAQAQDEKPESEPKAAAQRDYVVLPKGGHMPMLGLALGPEHDAAAVQRALAAGCRRFDCAGGKGSLAAVGQALLARRDELFICSQLSNEDHRPERAV